MKKTIEIIKAYWHLLTTRRTTTEQNKLNVCKTCTSNKHYFCTECKCFIPAKIKSPLANCPLNKWNATKTKEELLNELNNRFRDPQT